MDKLDNKGIIQFLLLILIAVGILVGVYLVQEQTKLKSKADVNGVNVSLLPSSVNAASNEEFTLSVFAQTTATLEVAGVELYISFDPDKLEVRSVQGGSTLPVVLDEGQIIGNQASIALGANPGALFNGNGEIASLRVVPKDGLTSSTSIQFTSQTQVVGISQNNVASVIGNLTSATITRPTIATPTPTPTPSSPPIGQQAVQVYRLVNSNGDHLYTASESEKDSAVSSFGYTYEGVRFYAYKEAGNNLAPVYRLNNANGDHFYTIDEQEKSNSISLSRYKLEGIAFYAYKDPAATLNPIYRLVNSGGYHFYTTSSSEKDGAVSNFGYKYEGIAFYVPPSP